MAKSNIRNNLFDKSPELNDASAVIVLQEALQTMKALYDEQKDQIKILEDENTNLQKVLKQLKEASHILNMQTHNQNQSHKEELNYVQLQLASLSQQQAVISEHLLRTCTENQELREELIQLSSSAGIQSPTAASKTNELIEDNGNNMDYESVDPSYALSSEQVMKINHGLEEIKSFLLEQQSNLKQNIHFISNLSKKGTFHLVTTPKSTEKECIVRTKSDFETVELEDDIEVLREWGTPQASIERQSPIEQDTKSTNNYQSQGIESVEELPIAVSSDLTPKDDRICPMCGAAFYQPCPFHDFENHVISHFDDDALFEQFEVVQS